MTEMGRSMAGKRATIRDLRIRERLEGPLKDHWQLVGDLYDGKRNISTYGNGRVLRECRDEKEARRLLAEGAEHYADEFADL